MELNDITKQITGLCDWCGMPVPLTIESDNTVCPACVQLLCNAGISDEEIYREP